ncbi:MAG: hypothetical protein CO090_04610 [Acidobacteria bacterium CG_4_9_14_3_um_filter_49_7]|nr:MAG: hypothetical protein CO090_04610 [Acidobacteria bacterium CG_4_9_14_3_um_filter_49_7]
MTRGNILIVDDDPLVRNSFAYLLEDEGYQTRQAGSTSEALRELADMEFDVALLDLKMEGETDGLLLNKAIHGKFPTVQTILITAYTNYNSAVKALKDGASDYLSKAASTKDVLAAIETAMKKRKETLKNADKYSPAPLATLSLVCNHNFFREGLLHFTEKHPDFVFTSHYRHLSEIFLQSEKPDGDIFLICADCALTELTTVNTVLHRFRTYYPESCIVFVNDNFTSEEKANLLLKGVRGFLSDKIDEDILTAALGKVAAGEIWAGRMELSKALRNHPDSMAQSLSEGATSNVLLSPRERDVLRFLAMNLSNKELSDRLSVSLQTVKTHLYNIYQKLDVHNRSQAIAAGYRHRFLP